MKENITDFETREVQKERVHCDYPSCMMTNEEGEIGTLKLYDNGERHYCSQHFKEVVGVEGNVARIDEDEGEVTVVIEETPTITMPWDKFRKPTDDPSNVDNIGGIGIALYPIVIALSFKANDDYDRGVRDTFIGTLLWIGVPLLLWFFILP